jgi:hypothetical protein
MGKPRGKNTERLSQDAVSALADIFQLTDAERTELLPSGQQAILNNRVAWAKTELQQDHWDLWNLMPWGQHRYQDLQQSGPVTWISERLGVSLEVGLSKYDNARTCSRIEANTPFDYETRPGWVRGKNYVEPFVLTDEVRAKIEGMDVEGMSGFYSSEKFFSDALGKLLDLKSPAQLAQAMTITKDAGLWESREVALYRKDGTQGPLASYWASKGRWDKRDVNLAKKAETAKSSTPEKEKAPSVQPVEQSAVTLPQPHPLSSKATITLDQLAERTRPMPELDSEEAWNWIDANVCKLVNNGPSGVEVWARAMDLEFIKFTDTERYRGCDVLPAEWQHDDEPATSDDDQECLAVA